MKPSKPEPIPLAEAEANYRRALDRLSTSVPALQGLAAVCRKTGREREAEGLLRRAVDSAPALPEPKAALAELFGSQGRHQEALGVLRELVRIRPDSALAHDNLGVALERTGNPVGAVESYRRAIALRPGSAEAHNHLGNALRAMGRHGEAEKAHREAIRLKPDYAAAYNGLAATLTALGQAAEAVACFRRLVELRPGSPGAGSDLLLALHYLDEVGPAEIFAEHVRWAETHAEPLYAKAPAHAPTDRGCAGGRPLRVGYVSTYLCEHPVARFFEPLLAAHDRKQVEVICYADVDRPDAVTARLRSYGHPWREIDGLTDEQAAQLVRQDQIDILVDLGGHMANRRLLLFARKPAPVQVAYIGYPDTTGLRTIDYRITDGWHDPPGPPGRADAECVETLIRLPRCCWSYAPGDDSPAVSALPADSTGRITFGVMNRLVKVTPRMLRLWAQVVSAVPNSRLMVLVAPGCEREPSVRERFAGAGIDAERLLLVPQRPRREYLELFSHVDVGLDTFPYAGHTTTCDAQWMGVPTVTLAGNTHVSRSGVSLLSAVGLPDLIARSGEEYVEIAVGLASDLPQLAVLRAGLRERMRQSPLCDGARLAREIEAAYREMWRKWCRSALPGR